MQRREGVQVASGRTSTRLSDEDFLRYLAALALVLLNSPELAVRLRLGELVQVLSDGEHGAVAPEKLIHKRPTDSTRCAGDYSNLALIGHSASVASKDQGR